MAGHTSLSKRCEEWRSSLSAQLGKRSEATYPDDDVAIKL